MDDDKKIYLGIGIFLAAIIILLFWLMSAKCEAETKDIGFEHRWSILSNCMIKKDGAWIPLNNYRAI